MATATELRAALTELIEAARVFTDPNVVDETDATIPLMDRLAQAIEASDRLNPKDT